MTTTDNQQLHARYLALAKALPQDLLTEEYAATDKFFAPYASMVAITAEQRNQVHAEIFALNLVLVKAGVRLAYRVDQFYSVATVRYIVEALAEEFILIPTNAEEEPLLVKRDEASLKQIRAIDRGNADHFLGTVLGYPYLWQAEDNDSVRPCYVISFDHGRHQLFGFKVPVHKYDCSVRLQTEALHEAVNAALTFLDRKIALTLHEL